MPARTAQQTIQSPQKLQRELADLQLVMRARNGDQKALDELIRPDPARLRAMGEAAADLIPLDADEKLARMILDAAGATDEDPRARRDPARLRPRPGALRGHRRRRAVGHRADHGAPGRAGDRQRRPRHPVPAVAARARRPRPPRLRRRPRRRGRHARGHHGRPRRQPRGARGSGTRAHDPAPLGRAEVGDGRSPGRRGRRHPRQDHDHLDADDGAARGRSRPDVRDRRGAGCDRPQRRRRQRRPLRGRGRRERRRLPGLRPRRRAGHQRRRRPPRRVGERGGLPRGLRRVRRHDPTRRLPRGVRRRRRRRRARRPSRWPGGSTSRPSARTPTTTCG